MGNVDENYLKPASDKSLLPRAYPDTWWEVPVALFGLSALIFAVVWRVEGLVILGIICLGIAAIGAGLGKGSRGVAGVALFAATIILTIIATLVAIMVLFQTRR